MSKNKAYYLEVQSSIEDERDAKRIRIQFDGFFRKEIIKVIENEWGATHRTKTIYRLILKKDANLTLEEVKDTIKVSYRGEIFGLNDLNLITGKELINNFYNEAVEELQCPGCIHGGSIQCGKFEQDPSFGKSCRNHKVGTLSALSGALYLGLPTGFNHVGVISDEIHNNIRIYGEKDVATSFDVFNVPVWYKETEKYLFVRTFLPRRNYTYIDIFVKGKAKDIKVNQSGDDIEDYESDEPDFIPINVINFENLID